MSDRKQTVFTLATTAFAAAQNINELREAGAKYAGDIARMKVSKCERVRGDYICIRNAYDYERKRIFASNRY